MTSMEQAQPPSTMDNESLAQPKDSSDRLFNLEGHPAKEILTSLEPVVDTVVSTRGVEGLEVYPDSPKTEVVTYTINGRKISFQSVFEQIMTEKMANQSMLLIGRAPSDLQAEVSGAEVEPASLTYEKFKDAVERGSPYEGAIVCAKDLASVLEAVDEISGTTDNSERIERIRDGKYTEEDLALVDAILAVSLINPEGDGGGMFLKADQVIDGEAIVITAMLGDEKAQEYVEACAKKYYEFRDEDEQRRIDSNRENVEKSGGSEKLQSNELALVHVTDYAPTLNEEGQYVILPQAQSTGVARSSIHTTMNHEVPPVDDGQTQADWHGKRYSIIMPAEAAMDVNGSPMGAHGVADIWFDRNPGEPFVLPKGSIIVAPEGDPMLNQSVNGIEISSYPEGSDRQAAFLEAMQEHGYPVTHSFDGETNAALDRLLLSLEARTNRDGDHRSFGESEAMAQNMQFGGAFEEYDIRYLMADGTSKASARTVYESGAVPGGRIETVKLEPDGIL